MDGLVEYTQRMAKPAKKRAETRRAMSLTLEAEQADMLEELAVKEGMSKMAVIRQALRIYYKIVTEIRQGGKVYTEVKTDNGTERTELFF